MKKLFVFALITGCFVLFSCKEKESERFKFLTGPVWIPVSLLANGADASGQGGLLEDFNGDVEFNEDGTGYFGSYTGTWRFDVTETKLVITSSSLPVSINANIIELTSTSLKLQFSFLIQSTIYDIQMTFRPK